MPQLDPPTSRLRRFFKWALISFLLVAGIWAGVLVWWQSSQRQITPQDALLYLLILPAGVLAGLAGFQWLRKRKHGKAATANAISPDRASNPSPAPAREMPALPILGAWSFTSAGASLEDFRQALIEKKRRPTPDGELLDEYGYPLHASRIADLDTAAVQEALEDTARPHASLLPADEKPGREAFLRTLALLSQLLDQLNADWPLADATADGTASGSVQGTLRGSEPATGQVESSLHLQIKLITPVNFSTAEQAQALSFVLEKTALLPLDERQIHVVVRPCADDATALLLAESFRIEVINAERPHALLLLAAESTLCPTVVEHWQAEQRLFGSQVPHGLMPGEAGFAVLCVNHAALPLALTEPACLLRRVVSSRRDTSADSAGKPSHATLDAVIGAALTAAEIADGAAIGDVACDADHRSSRVLECIGAMLQQMPQLDAIANRLAVNETCGHTGAASGAGSWVAGIAQARDASHPVLVFNVSHAFERAAAVLLPVGSDNQFLQSGSP